MTILPTQSIYQTLYERIHASWSGLLDKPEETPETTLKALWHAAAGNALPVEHAAQMELPEMDEKSLASLERLVELRLAGMPLAYITGRQCFLGIPLIASAHAMIPRKETEIVGRASVSTAHSLAEERESVNVVDLCTGSGNLALAIAVHEPRCRVLGIDITAEAVMLAEQNARFLHLENRARFVQGNLFEPIDHQEFHHKVDLITCNPPYISSEQVNRLPEEIKNYEPRHAFDGGAFGIAIIARLIRESPRFLKPGSWLVFEVGLGQGEYFFRQLKRNENFDQVETYKDDMGEVRALRARKGSTL